MKHFVSRYIVRKIIYLRAFKYYYYRLHKTCQLLCVKYLYNYRIFVLIVLIITVVRPILLNIINFPIIAIIDEKTIYCLRCYSVRNGVPHTTVFVIKMNANNGLIMELHFVNIHLLTFITASSNCYQF